MSRVVGIAAATMLTAASLTGSAALIILDFVGADGMRLFLQHSGEALSRLLAAQNNHFAPGKEITFFETVPVAGTKLVVDTGAAYDSVLAVQSLKPTKHWCYINVASDIAGIHGRVDLGQQTGENAPVYASAASLAAVQLTKHGISADELAALARSHCRFGNVDPFSPSS